MVYRAINETIVALQAIEVNCKLYTVRNEREGKHALIVDIWIEVDPTH